MILNLNSRSCVGHLFCCLESAHFVLTSKSFCSSFELIFFLIWLLFYLLSCAIRFCLHKGASTTVVLFLFVFLFLLIFSFQLWTFFYLYNTADVVIVVVAYKLMQFIEILYVCSIAHNLTSFNVFVPIFFFFILFFDFLLIYSFNFYRFPLSLFLFLLFLLLCSIFHCFLCFYSTNICCCILAGNRCSRVTKFIFPIAFVVQDHYLQLYNKYLRVKF